MSKSITMAQVAKELGVSTVTVSAVINGHEKRQRVSPKTVKRIQEHLDQCGYVPSKSALQIKKGIVTNPVGILYCGDFLQYSHLQKGLSLLANHIEKKYGMVEISGISSGKIKKGIREQVAKGVKRLIWIHVNPPREERINAEKLFPLLNRMEQTVIYNYDSHKDIWADEYLKRRINLVGFDRSDSYRKTAHLLKKHGHSKIALNEVFWGAKHGLTGTEILLATFEEYGFEIYGLIGENNISHNDEIHIITENLIKLYKKHQVRCAFIRNDLLAAEVMCKLVEKAIRVPEDIAIIGFGENPFSRLLPVPLTTFQHPVEKMCAKTIELIEKKSSGIGEKYFFKNKFVLRNSHNK